ncbi:hypothetical protein TVAG_170770 [Trichomonas vaginalis G3]|uniref:Uncharacterized protein n=1 Tax=Trichomonas vaginalis (strain ATCC PRA-98 / G3) TaxID=412133 RepID=A2GTM8_TRIV3|nr:hypothetical protein TVAGG3_0385800 [Trichomonas vaginalis G3]EAX79489.1 hypothetical protein TVAG_170770 [Trichomonas vaginalis G3]KAI5533624.1 hypothetical protein TVAGG3_0385800 [Trichomonas vaginalis G3]|eukprot:XP_001292419.1 hypothetical protein [Trichomonas vaginalis G3]
MAQVALDGKLPRQILLAFRVLPSDRKNSSFQQEKNFPTTGRTLPSNWKNFSCCSSVNHSNFRKLRTFFPTTGKIFPDNWKKISRQLEKFFPTTGKVLPSDRTQTNVRRSSS